MWRSRTNPSPWGILALLLALVLVPTAGVVWFMAAAMSNERAAAKEALTAAYRARLDGYADRILASWEGRRATLDSADSRGAPPMVFASLVRDGVADSVIVYGDGGEIVLYPAGRSPGAALVQAEPAAWVEAQRLEFAEGRPLEAARAYAQIAATARDADRAARALQAQARSLGKAGRSEEAIDLLLNELGGERFTAARDGRGRLVAPDSFLVALHLASETDSNAARRAGRRLQERLENYGEPSMPIAQRRFLMRRLAELRPGEAPADTFAAEQLAEAFLAADPSPAIEVDLSPTSLPGIWRLSSSDGTVVGLWREASIPALSLREVDPPPAGSRLELLPPGRDGGKDAFLTITIDGLLPAWRLSLHLDDQQLVAAAASEEVTGYLWTGALLIAAAIALAAVAAAAIRRQMRVAKLKNDLVATVTHELKTPLASMRLLVDTLLDGSAHDQQQVREYLELLASENERLSALIDDFLAFSRMERNKQAFAKVEIRPETVARSAEQAVRQRLENDRCQLDVDIAPDLPRIVGDPDALSTVLVNLLDNANKYSREDKRIRLSAYSDNGSVVFDVEDHGIGLTPRAAKRVFERFYQVDDKLSRRGSGVGLGLAIVKFIVDAHQGEVSVTSQPGDGSTFRVRVPVAPEAGVS